MRAPEPFRACDGARLYVRPSKDRNSRRRYQHGRQGRQAEAERPRRYERKRMFQMALERAAQHIAAENEEDINRRMAVIEKGEW